MDDITDFLYLIGSVFAPMIAIQIADFFVLHKIADDENDEGSSAENMKQFNWCRLTIWLVGFILYRCLMQVDLPVGNTLPTMLAVIAICFIIEFFAKRIRNKNSN